MGNRGHILLADDDPDFVVLLQVALKRAGIHNPVHTVDNGLQVIDYLNGTGPYADRARYPIPYLALIYLKLPGQNGFDLVRWIRAQEKFRDLTAVIVSGSEFGNEAERAHELGANGFMAKPCRYNMLVEMLQERRDSW